MRNGDRDRHSRPLGRAEAFFWFMGQARCGNAVIMAEMTGEVTAERLQDAVDRAQRRHPLLRAGIVRRGLRMRLELEAHPTRIMVQSLESGGWRDEVTRQMDRPFPPGVSPLIRCHLFRGPGPSVVVALVYCHAIGDGLSSASLLGEVLGDATADGTPPARPALEFRAPIEAALPPVRALSARFLARRFSDWARLGLPRRLPGFRDVVHRERDVRILSLRLDEPQSTGLLSKCRSESATVNGALAAALLQALHGELDGARPATLALSSPMDLRARATPAIGPDEVGNYIGHVVTVHRPGPEARFWDLAREFSAELRRYVDEGYGQATWMALPPSWSVLPQGLWARLLTAVLRVQPPSAMLTNLGRVAAIDLHGKAEIRSLSFGLSPIFRDALALCACSHQGVLALNLVFSARALPPEAGERIAMRLHSTLSRIADEPPGPAPS